jgi:hypothetical protein
MNKKVIIEFAEWLTGHDEETIIQVYDDWTSSPARQTIQPDNLTELIEQDNNSGRVMNYKKKMVGKEKKKTSMKIMIKEKTGKYGDWTGSFNLKKGETFEQLKARVEDHFNHHFNTGEYADKEFVLVIVNEGVRTIESNFSL